MLAFSLIALLLWVLQLLPKEIFNPNPATGGDMGSHFWPLYTLVNYALPDWSLYTWNPGNLAGEPHLIHYFPLPFLIMAIFSSALPLGTAFNIGTVLPIFLIPLSAFIFARQAAWKFPAPPLAAIFSAFFVFNESHLMWGGNALSTMAGQFSHGYALAFFLLGAGALLKEIRENRIPLWSSLFMAGVALSHGYVLLGVPWFYLGSFLFAVGGRSLRALKICTISGLFAASFSLWFIIPMLENSAWTIAYFFEW